MSRPPTGTVEYRPGKNGRPGKWWGRITAVDGSRPWLELGEWPNSPQGRARAKEAVAARSERARARGLCAAPQRTVSDAADWWSRYFEHRKALGIETGKGAYETHLKPVLDKPWEVITTAECEELRDHLDAKSQLGTVSQKTAFNAWTVWTTAAKAASGTWKKDKSKKLKVRDGNPCLGVLPPDFDKDGKQLQWLYPDEFLRLVACERVPLQERRNYALGVYLFVRGGELKALLWEDVDTDRGIVTVRIAYDRETGEVKGTKIGNRGIRKFVVEPELLPLLRAMREESGGTGNVVKMRLQKWWAADLRKHLRWAGVTREALFTTDATRKNLRFHDLRSTGLTWMAVRGDDPLKIQQRAGHLNFATTQKYIRTAEEVGDAIGQVFPALPESLIRPKNRLQAAQVLETIVEAPGIEPPPTLLDQQESATNHEGENAANEHDRRASVRSQVPIVLHSSEVTAEDLEHVVEPALVRAIAHAVRAERWAAVELIARELERRRVARSGEGSMNPGCQRSPKQSA